MNSIKRLNKIIENLHEVNNLLDKSNKDSLDEKNEYESFDKGYELHLYKFPLSWKNFTKVEESGIANYPYRGVVSTGNLEIYTLGKNFDDLFMEESDENIKD